MSSSLPPISEDDLYAALQGDPRFAGLAAGARASQPLPAPSPHHISIDEVLAMLDQQDALDGGSPALGNPGALSMMGSPPATSLDPLDRFREQNYGHGVPLAGPVHEPAAQLPAPSGGAGYLRRLGLQFAAHPIEYRTPPRGRASDPERFLMSLLANSANALGTRATQSKAEEDALNLDLRTQAAERNKANIKASQDYRTSMLMSGREAAAGARSSKERELDRQARLDAARIAAAGRGGSAMNTINGQIDPEALADAIYNGDQAPDLRQYGRPVQAAVGTWLQKKYKFNLYKAGLELQAWSSYYKANNTSLPLRLRQSIQNASSTVDAAEQAVNNLKSLAPRVGLNSVNHIIQAGVKQGFASPEAANEAQQLASYIGALQFELSNIYQGGGVPTDQAQKKASTIINADMGPDQLPAAITAARREIAWRQDAVFKAGPVTPDNPTGVREMPGTAAAARSGTVHLRRGNQDIYVPAEKADKARSDGFVEVADAP